MSLGMQPHKLRTDGKPVIYKVNGTGRDMYIGRTNGGLLSQDLLHSIERDNAGKPDFPRMRYGSGGSHRPATVGNAIRATNLALTCEKFVHYKCDGTGRDGYVRFDHGGHVSNYPAANHSEQIFRSTLRSPSVTPLSQSQSSSKNTSATATTTATASKRTKHNSTSNLHGMSAGTASALGISRGSQGFDFTNTNYYLSPKQIKLKNEAHAKQTQESNRLSQPKMTSVQPSTISDFSIVNSRYSYYAPKKQNKNNNVPIHAK